MNQTRRGAGSGGRYTCTESRYVLQTSRQLSEGSVLTKSHSDRCECVNSVCDDSIAVTARFTGRVQMTFEMASVRVTRIRRRRQHCLQKSGVLLVDEVDVAPRSVLSVL